MFQKLILSSLIIAFILGCGCSSQPPDRLAERYTYDSRENLINYQAPDGSKLSYSYEANGLPREMKYHGGAVTFGYHTSGAPLWMADNTGVTEYYYDVFDRVIAAAWKHDISKLVIYSYDSSGNPDYLGLVCLQQLSRDPSFQTLAQDLLKPPAAKKAGWPDLEKRCQKLISSLPRDPAASPPPWLEYQVRYHYDLYGRLAAVDTAAGRLTYTCQPGKGVAQRLLPNGVTTSYTYGDRGELKNLRHTGRDGAVLAEYRYTVNPAGKITLVEENTPQRQRSMEYFWDQRGYLRGVKLPDHNYIRYDYDSFGNRLVKEFFQHPLLYRYNRFGLLTQAGNTTYKWDLRGNMTGLSTNREKTTIKYDGRSLPIDVKTPGDTLSLSWDGAARLIAKKTSRETQYYLPQPVSPQGPPLAVYNAQGKLLTSFIYGDVAIGQKGSDGSPTYFLEDGFNSIRQLVDANGRLVGERFYSVFGELLSSQGERGPPLRSSGEWYLPEIKMYSLGGRLYDPAVGRFVSGSSPGGYLARVDSLNPQAHGCSQPDRFMEPRCHQFHKKVSPASPDALSFTRALTAGRFFGTRFGEEAAAYWAQRQLATDNVLYAVPGVFASLWTSETWQQTALTLTPHFLFKGFGKAATLINAWTGGNNDREFLHIPLAGRFAHLGVGPHGPHIGIGAGKKALVHLYPDRIYIGDGKHGQDIKIHWHVLGAGLFSLLQGLPPLGPDQPANSPVRPVMQPAGSENRGQVTQSIPWPDKQGFLTDPFQSLAPSGGVHLNAQAEVFHTLGPIKGVTYDPEKKIVLLLGEDNTSLSGPSLKPEDFAVALALVAGPRPQEAQFSLDPEDRTNPRGKWLRSVYLPNDLLNGTTFGQTLFEADWLLKQYAFGVKIDADGKIQPRTSNVPQYQSTADLSLANPRHQAGRENWSRFWIVVDEMKLNREGNSVYFEKVRMRIRTKKQVPDPTSPTGLRDVDTADDPVSSQFAALFTQHYDAFAREEPAFDRVRQLAMAVALAKWIKEKGVPLDWEWVTRYLNQRIETVQRVTALSTEKRHTREEPFTQNGRQGTRILTQIVHLFGGVDLTVKPTPGSAPESDRNLHQSLVKQLPAKDHGPVVSIRHQGKNYTGMVLPVTKQGQEIWAKNPTYKKGEVVYELDRDGRVRKTTAANGDVAHYGYNPQGKLDRYTASNAAGWQLQGNKTASGSIWEFQTPRQNLIKLHYASGLLKQVEVDGRILAQYQVNQAQRQITALSDRSKETATFDAKGNLTEYEVTQKDQLPGNIQSQKLSLTYNQAGQPTKISSPGLAPLNLTYTADGQRIAALKLPGEELTFTYSPDGQFRGVSSSKGDSLSFQSSGPNSGLLQEKRAGSTAEIRWAADGSGRCRDHSGLVTDFKSSHGLLTSIRPAGLGETSVAYDADKRLQTITFPDGSRKEFRSETAKPKKPSGDAASSAVSVISHPSKQFATELADIYQGLRSSLNPEEYAEKLQGRNVGPFKILQAHWSYTDARILEVQTPHGVGMLKVLPYSETKLQEVQRAQAWQKLFQHQGQNVPQVLPVMEGQEIYATDKIIATLETKAPGIQASKAKLTPQQEQKIVELAFKLFFQGQSPSLETPKPPVDNQVAMRRRLLTYNEEAKELKDFFSRCSTQSRFADADTKAALEQIHVHYEKLVKALFSDQPVPLKDLGYIHDNQYGNFFIDKSDKVAAIDFQSDRRGNVGEAMAVLIKEKMARDDKFITFQEYKDYVNLLFDKYQKESGRSLADSDRQQIISCMIPILMKISGSDSNLVMAEFLRETGIPPELYPETNWSDLLADKKIDDLLARKIVMKEASYLRNMKQLEYTLRLLKEQPLPQETLKHIDRFLETLHKVIHPTPVKQPERSRPGGGKPAPVPKPNPGHWTYLYPVPITTQTAGRIA